MSLFIHLLIYSLNLLIDLSSIYIHTPIFSQNILPRKTRQSDRCVGCATWRPRCCARRPASGWRPSWRRSSSRPVVWTLGTMGKMRGFSMENGGFSVALPWNMAGLTQSLSKSYWRDLLWGCLHDSFFDVSMGIWVCIGIHDGYNGMQALIKGIWIQFFVIVNMIYDQTIVATSLDSLVWGW